MSDFILEPTAKAAWHRLVTDAQQRSNRPLDEARESYLVFLLMRYLSRPDLVRSVLALQFLRGSLMSGRRRQDSMQEVGDQCLIFAGLFPEQAERRRVRPSYFINLGKAAYVAVAGDTTPGSAMLYHGLAEAFVALTDVLQALRAVENEPLYDVLQAAEHWAETGSTTAFDELKKFTDAIPMTTPSQRPQ